MVIEFFLNLILAFCRAILVPDHIEDLPDRFLVVLGTALGYIIDGMRIICAFIHVEYIAALLAFCCFIYAVHLAYDGIMWVLRKIPFISID